MHQLGFLKPKTRNLKLKTQNSKSKSAGALRPANTLKALNTPAPGSSERRTRGFWQIPNPKSKTQNPKNPQHLMRIMIKTDHYWIDKLDQKNRQIGSKI